MYKIEPRRKNVRGRENIKHKKQRTLFFQILKKETESEGN